MPNNNPQQTTPQQQIARAAETANKAAERLGETAEHATSVAIEKVRQVRDEAQSGIEHQRAEVADRIRRLGGVLRASSQTLSTDDPLAQQLFASAGDRIEKVAEYIGSITPGELASDVQSLARRRPGLFFGGSFIIGLALGRFVKSSAAAAVGSGSSDSSSSDLDYDATLTMRKAPSRRTGKTQQQGASSSGRGAGASASSTSASPSPSGASSTQGGATQGGASSASKQQPAGSTSTGTVGSGSAQGASSGPSYGSASSVTTSSKPQSQAQSAPSATPRDVERGEGSKS